MEGKNTLINLMPKTIEFLCISKKDRAIINDGSCITLTDINQEFSPYLLVSKISKDSKGVSIFPGSIVRIINNPEQHYVADIFDSGEIILLNFSITEPKSFLDQLDQEDYKLMCCNTFIEFSSIKLEVVGHVYDELRNKFDLKLDHFRRLL